MTHGLNYWYYLPLNASLDTSLNSPFWKVGWVFALLTTHQALAIHSSYIYLVTHYDDRPFLNVIVTGQLVRPNFTQNCMKLLTNDLGLHVCLRAFRDLSGFDGMQAPSLSSGALTRSKVVTDFSL